MKNPEAVRQAIVEAVSKLMRASAPTERMSTRETTEVIVFVATAAISVVLSQIAAEMRAESFDESAGSGACHDAVMLARDLGYRAGHNDMGRRWSKLLDEVSNGAR